MTEQEAAEKMDEMWNAVQTFQIPIGFKISVDVPMEIANKARRYHSSRLFNYDGDFAAGEPFHYKGIRCFATPEK